MHQEQTQALENMKEHEEQDKCLVTEEKWLVYAIKGLTSCLGQQQAKGSM